MNNEQQLAVNSTEMMNISPEERETVELYKAKIDLKNKSSIIQYGSASQNQMVSFSEEVLRQVRTKDMGAVGDTLAGLVADLKVFDKAINQSGFWGFFMRLKKKIIRIKAEYDRIEKNVVHVEVQLERHYQTLLKDVTLFDKLFEKNEQHFRELSLYVLAGEEKIAEVKGQLLPALQAEYNENNDSQVEQKINDLVQQIDQFEKKIHDLKISRIISLQLAPQIRMVQNNSMVLMDKVHSSIVNTLPLWRNQMVLALGLVHSQQTLEAQKAVNDATNQMLQRNSEMLRNSSTQIARENERSIVDIETLQKVNSDLFATIDDILKIQTEGRQKRQAAEVELRKVEDELSKILRVR